MPKMVFSGRIDDTIFKALSILNKSTMLSRGDILELSLIDFISKWNGQLQYEGVDFKEYCQTIKSQRLRRIISKQRQEFLSKELFIPRVRMDIWKLIFLKKNSDFKKDMSTVLGYIKLRKKEAEQYKDNKELIKELDFFEVEIKEKKLQEIKNHIIGNMDDINFMKKISNKNE